MRVATELKACAKQRASNFLLVLGSLNGESSALNLATGESDLGALSGDAG